MYVPRKSADKQSGHNNNDGEYEGMWSGPHELDPAQIRRSHNTSRLATVAAGYEDKPIRVQRWPTTGYLYRIVDGNKRLAEAKRQQQPKIVAYIFEGLVGDEER